MAPKHDNPLEEQADLLDQAGIAHLTAKDAMIRPIFLTTQDKAGTILKKLKKEAVNACIVIDKDKHFIGEISDNDIIRLFVQQTKTEPLVKTLNRGYRREFLYKTAEELACKHKRVVHKNTPINEVISLCYKKGFEYIPVLDANDKVLGVVTPSSIIDLLKDY
jgi:predicted transcriptional regulator